MKIKDVILQHIMKTLKEQDMNASKAASILDIERKSIYTILKRNNYRLYKKNLWKVNNEQHEN